MADSDLADLRKQCITSLYLCTDNVSKYLDDEKEAEFAKLKSYVEGYCVLETQQAVAIQALERAKSETETSNIDSIQDRFASHLNNLAGTRLRINNHPFMMEFNKKMERGMQMARENLDESDLAITESQNQYIDPITKRPIENPVKNTICGHVYERDAIMSVISRKNRTKCPVAGCGNKEPVTANNLLEDEELRLRLTLTQHSTMVQDRSVTNLDNTMN